MRFVKEYRDATRVHELAAKIRAATTQPHRIMEICGGQTHAILRFGLDQMLPPEITLIHGPGCPVCVTSARLVDQAIALARRPEVTLCSFGDILRVPGSESDLLAEKARGADVRMVYSPLDALRIARQTPARQVVFFAVGFETTAPANVLAVQQAHRQELANFSILSAQVRVPPAIEALLAAPDCQVDGFLAAGHVCTIMGTHEYEDIARRRGVPMVVTGFEPVDLLYGVYHCVRLLEHGEARVENAYARSVRPEGNPQARALLEEFLEPVDREWRGLGIIPQSGLDLRERYAAYDAARRFEVALPETQLSSECISGEVLRGVKKPSQCPAFGVRCTPEQPLGAPMVSGEGACAAYYRYRMLAGAGTDAK